MEINLICAINKLGYGYAGSNIFKALVKMGVDVSLFPINSKNIEADPSDHEIIKEGIKRAEFFDSNAPSIRIWHAHDMSMFPGNGKRIGFPIFELDTFSDLEKHQLLSCDEWMVCSMWARGLMINELQVPECDSRDNEDDIRDIADCTHVVPLGVDSSIFKPSDAPIKTRSYDGTSPFSDLRNSRTIFLNIGKWEVRKGHDVLVDMFNQAFTQEDNVELWMMCENCFNTEEETNKWETKYLDSPLGNKIKLIPRQVTQTDMVRIINKADVGVFPTRAEGWNLEPLEMMACGKHIITTNYSGHTEYCTPYNSRLIEPAGREDAFDSKWFFGQGKWAYFNKEVIDGFVNEMQVFNTMKQNGVLGINTGGTTTANKFSWDNSAEKLLEAIT